MKTPENERIKIASILFNPSPAAGDFRIQFIFFSSRWRTLAFSVVSSQSVGKYGFQQLKIGDVFSLYILYFIYKLFFFFIMGQDILNLQFS